MELATIVTTKGREDKPREREREERNDDKEKRASDERAQREKRLKEERDREKEREILLRQRERSKSPETCIDGSKPLFVGNIDSYVVRKDIEDAFGEYGEVTKIDLRRGFCFVWIKGRAREAKDAFNGKPFGISKRILKVRWAMGKEKERFMDSNPEPCETLFIANFGPFTTSKEVEDLFSKYGHVVRVSLKKNFGFVQFSEVKEAIEATRNLDGIRVFAH